MVSSFVEMSILLVVLVDKVCRSMGASTVLSLNKAFRLGLTSLRLESSVLIGNLLRCENNPFDLNFPLNLLNLVGINDELFDPTEALTVMSECVVNGTVTEGEWHLDVMGNCVSAKRIRS